MGIRELFAYINKYHPEVVEYILLSDYANKKIAIDGNLLFTKHWSVFCSNYVDSMDVREEKIDTDPIFADTMKSLLGNINTLLSFKITPVFIFDGGMEPQKQATCEKRREVSDKYRKKLEKSLEKIRNEVFIEEKDEKEIRSAWKVVTKPNKHLKEKAREILLSLGIPVVISKTDGEKLCCSLYLEDKVQGIFADDSDCIPFGGLDFFTKIEKMETGEKVFRSISTIKLLSKLEISFDQLIDACILSGCDYNDHLRVRGFSVNKSIESIKQYENIEGVIKNIKADFTCTNYVICRELFRYIPSFELIIDSSPLNLMDIDEENVNFKEFGYELNIFKKLRNEILDSH